jgi:D-3-phosphoglycerate dehydrogenase
MCHLVPDAQPGLNKGTRSMKIAVLDDYQDAFAHLRCYDKLKGHDVTVIHEHAKDDDDLVSKVGDAEAVILNQQRTSISAGVLKALPRLKFISQTGRNTGHIDIAACAQQGVAVSAGGTGGGNAPAELAWGLILSAVRRIPQEVAALKAGRWQTSLGTGLVGKTLGIYGFGRIGTIVAGVGRAFGMKVMCWTSRSGWRVPAKRDLSPRRSERRCSRTPTFSLCISS